MYEKMDTQYILRLDTMSDAVAYVGTGSGNTATDQNGELTISSGAMGTDYNRENGVITILTGVPLPISGNGKACKKRIVVGQGVSAQLTIRDADIFTVYVPIEIATGSTMVLTPRREKRNVLGPKL